MQIQIEGWEDGHPFKRTLDVLDRWAVHNSLRVVVKACGTEVSIKQSPGALSEQRAGVGACLWDASFVLTAFLGAPSHSAWHWVKGSVEVVELEWGQPNSMQVIDSLRGQSPDFVIAADCLYIDEGGSTPKVDHFVDACAALCGSFTQCFVALEQRSTSVMQAFFMKTRNAGFHVERMRANAEMMSLQAEHIVVLKLTKTD
ncbi:hypothetical protein WJX75_000614 [Coccomyxa subellipsoidea]|uniref:S-adenosyl-L-methionine-dependent methyltransferase n=1 Tax=Coccomyxa subellipsoidea TaxID=248742 RepID=A0ABR2YH23_9CHLO